LACKITLTARLFCFFREKLRGQKKKQDSRGQVENGLKKRVQGVEESRNKVSEK
jgi:hypothetical protein